MYDSFISTLFCLQRGLGPISYVETDPKCQYKSNRLAALGSKAGNPSIPIAPCNYAWPCTRQKKPLPNAAGMYNHAPCSCEHPGRWHFDRRASALAAKHHQQLQEHLALLISPSLSNQMFALSIGLAMRPSLPTSHQSIHERYPSVCLSICASVCPPLSLSVSVSVAVSISVSVSVPVSVSLSPSLCLSLSLSLWDKIFEGWATRPPPLRREMQEHAQKS